MELIVVRHPRITTPGLCYGRFDVAAEPTTTEVDAVADGARDATRIYSSPSSRAAVLSERVAARLRIPLQWNPELVEISFGAWEGRSWSDIESTDAVRLTRWMQDYVNETPPDGEPLREFESRVRRALTAIGTEGVPLLVTHAGVIRALAVILERTTWAAAMAMPVPHCTVRRFFYG